MSLYFLYVIFFPLQAAFYLGHSLRDFNDTSATQANVKKLREELKLSQSQKEKLVEEVRALKGRLGDLSRENIRMFKDFEEAEARHDELLSRKKDMLDKAFTYIMMEVWSVDPELVVPRVKKRVDKSAILKAIKDRKVTQAPPSLSP